MKYIIISQTFLLFHTEPVSILKLHYVTYLQSLTNWAYITLLFQETNFIINAPVHISASCLKCQY